MDLRLYFASGGVDPFAAGGYCYCWLPQRGNEAFAGLGWLLVEIDGQRDAAIDILFGGLLWIIERGYWRREDDCFSCRCALACELRCSVYQIIDTGLHRYGGPVIRSPRPIGVIAKSAELHVTASGVTEQRLHESMNLVSVDLREGDAAPAHRRPPFALRARSRALAASRSG